MQASKSYMIVVSIFAILFCHVKTDYSIASSPENTYFVGAGDEPVPLSISESNFIISLYNDESSNDYIVKFKVDRPGYIIISKEGTPTTPKKDDFIFYFSRRHTMVDIGYMYRLDGSSKEDPSQLGLLKSLNHGEQNEDPLFMIKKIPKMKLGKITCDEDTNEVAGAYLSNSEIMEKGKLSANLRYSEATDSVKDEKIIINGSELSVYAAIKNYFRDRVSFSLPEYPKNDWSGEQIEKFNQYLEFISDEYYNMGTDLKEFEDTVEKNLVKESKLDRAKFLICLNGFLGDLRINLLVLAGHYLKDYVGSMDKIKVFEKDGKTINPNLVPILKTFLQTYILNNYMKYTGEGDTSPDLDQPNFTKKVRENGFFDFNNPFFNQINQVVLEEYSSYQIEGWFYINQIEGIDEFLTEYIKQSLSYPKFNDFFIEESNLGGDLIKYYSQYFVEDDLETSSEKFFFDVIKENDRRNLRLLV